MKKTVNIVIGIVALALVAGFFIPTNKKQTVINSTTYNMDYLNYLEYSDAHYEISKSKGYTVLFFAATSWCQSCSDLDKEILANPARIPSNVTILKVDYDYDTVMNEKYVVTAQHTLIVLDNKGNELNRWVGGDLEFLTKELSKIQQS